MPVKIKNKETSLFTIVLGEENKETVILLHGGPGVPENMRPLMESLSGKFRVICFHQRGTLNSPCPGSDYSMESYISDIDCIASHFKLHEFHLFGHSWGGLYAGIFAEKRPGKILSLFLCSPASGTGKQWLNMGWEVQRFNKRKSSFREWTGMISNSFFGLLGFNKAHQKFFKQFAINCNKNYKVEKTAPLLPHLVRARPVNRTIKAVLKYPKLRQMNSPAFKITITYGDDDIYGDSKKYVRKRYPTARFVDIPKCSHMHWLHNREAFFKIMAKHYDLPY